MKHRSIGIWLVAMLVMGISAWAEEQAAAPARAENFTLEDFTGKSWELYQLKDAEAVVLYMHGVGCPIVRLSVPVLEKLKQTYAPKKVTFLMVNSNWLDDAEGVKADAEDFSITMPILLDQKQTVAKSLGVTRTCTTFVLDPQDDWKIVYRGALDDRQDYGVQRQHSVREHVKIALDEHLAGKPITTSTSEAKGCLINFLADDEVEEESN